MAKAKYPKKPKAPKGGSKASLTALKGYEEKLKIWEKKCKEIDSAEKQRQALWKKVSGK